MLIAGIALGLLLGLFLGGKIERLADIRLRFLPLLFAGVILRFGTEARLVYDVPTSSTSCACRCSGSPTGSCCSRSGRTAATRASRSRSSVSPATRS